MKKIKLVFLIVAVVICAGVFVACGGEAAPKKTFNEFISAMNACYADGFKDADMERVAATFGSSESKEYKDALADIKAAKSKSEKDNYTIELAVVKFSQWSVGDKEASVTIKVKVDENDDGKKSTDSEEKSVKFKKVGDEWYIDVITFTFFD